MEIYTATTIMVTNGDYDNIDDKNNSNYGDASTRDIDGDDGVSDDYNNNKKNPFYSVPI